MYGRCVLHTYFFLRVHRVPYLHYVYRASSFTSEITFLKVSTLTETYGHAHMHYAEDSQPLLSPTTLAR